MRYIAFLLITGAVSCLGQEDPEDFRLETTLSAWRTAVRGTLQSGIIPVNLHTDLALQPAWTFYGKLTFKPGRRHRIFLEGSPYSFNGLNALARTIDYRGITYTVQDTIGSEASMTWFDAGYQFDVLTGEHGHLGVQVSGAYVDATGTLRSQTTGVQATRSETIGLPLAGAEGRVWLLPGRRLLSLNGEIKGMAFGGYGHFVQTMGGVGVGIRWVTLQAGYGFVDADIHESRSSANPAGIAPRFTGPMFSLQLRDR